MNLLNEATRRYPNAISFLAGRPPQELVSAQITSQWLQVFADAAAVPESGPDWAALGQYSNTNGIILEQVACYLRNSGFTNAAADECLITNGAQEALVISLAKFCGQSKIAFAADPSYVGFSGAASVLGVAIETAPDDADFLTRLEQRASRSPSIGCVYVIPDFANPSTRVMGLEERRRLVELADQYDFYVIEDAAYRHFRYTGEELPTIKSLDNSGRVVYVESFAKTVLPGLRLAVMYADQRDPHGQSLAQNLSEIKSYLSVATSPINQAMLAGLLIKEQFCLQRWIAPRRDRLAGQCHYMLDAMARHWRPFEASGISWSKPEGGYFVVVTLPFKFNADDFEQCVGTHDVLVMPMSAFSIHGNCASMIRLAFSNVSPQQIELGVAGMADYFSSRLGMAAS